MLPQPAAVQPHVTQPALVNRQVSMLGDIWQVKAAEAVGGAVHRMKMTNSCKHNCGNNPFYFCCVGRLQKQSCSHRFAVPGGFSVILGTEFLEFWLSALAFKGQAVSLALFCQLGKTEELTLGPRVLGTDSI